MFYPYSDVLLRCVVFLIHLWYYSLNNMKAPTSMEILNEIKTYKEMKPDTETYYTYLFIIQTISKLIFIGHVCSYTRQKMQKKLQHRQRKMNKLIYQSHKIRDSPKEKHVSYYGKYMQVTTNKQ